ncbi:hypothetical protein IMY05_006G0175400 [Salix suchowensis]|nr:hypothetical protein IMY05_006G0175400 [Salix suchowensis]
MYIASSSFARLQYIDIRTLTVRKHESNPMFKQKLMAFRRVQQAEPASYRKIISGDSSVKQESGDQNILSDALTP